MTGTLNGLINPDAKIVGVDRSALGGRYDAVLSTSFRADPDVLVICNPEAGEREFAFIERAFMAGHSVYLVVRPDHAPSGTRWLQIPIP